MKKQLLLAILMLLPFVVNASGINPNLGFSTNEHWDANRGFVGTRVEPCKSPGLVNPYNVGPIVWSSSNPEVATIDANGNVTLVSAGRTQITAYYAGDSEFIERKNEYALTITSTLTATLATLRVYSDSHSTRQN